MHDDLQVPERAQWLQARLYIENDWWKFLKSELYPFADSLRCAGLIRLDSFQLGYERGVYLDWRLACDRSSVHTVLLPGLREQFDQPKSIGRDGHTAGRLFVRPFEWKTVGVCSSRLEAALAAADHLGSRILQVNAGERAPGADLLRWQLQTLFERVEVGPGLAAAVLQDLYAEWLEVYLAGRYDLFQTGDRHAHEREITSFLLDQPVPVRRVQLPQKQLLDWLDAIALVIQEAEAASPAAIEASPSRWIEEELRNGVDLTVRRALKLVLRHHSRRIAWRGFEEGQFWLQLQVQQRAETIQAGAA